MTWSYEVKLPEARFTYWAKTWPNSALTKSSGGAFIDFCECWVTSGCWVTSPELQSGLSEPWWEGSSDSAGNISLFLCKIHKIHSLCYYLACSSTVQNRIAWQLMKWMFLKNTFWNDNCFLSLKYVGILQCFLLGFLSHPLWQQREKKAKGKKQLLKRTRIELIASCFLRPYNQEISEIGYLFVNGPQRCHNSKQRWMF